MSEKQEIVLKGIAAAPGIAVGPAYIYHRQVPQIPERRIAVEEVDGEIERLKNAVARSEKELRKILSFAEQKIGDSKAKIFEAQIMILNDTLLFDAIYKRIREEKKNAEFIVHDEISKYQKLMLVASDEYIRERARDVEDLKHRIIRNIQENRLFSKFEGRSIVVSENLTSADTILFSRNDVLGYAMELGGTTSHAALVSRALKIPSVSGLREVTTKVNAEDFVIVDGYSGIFIVHPTEERLAEYEAKQKKFAEFEQKLVGLRELPSQTIDGRRVELEVNIEFEEELEFALLQGAEGVGLYRTERLLIDRDTIPTEEDQYAAYKNIADEMFPHNVTLRTFDVGGDKVLPQSIKENNPFLGWRGIRVCLDEPELFLQQLRAMLRTSVRKNVSIMFPMVTKVQEVRKAKEMLEEAKRQLGERSIPFDEKLKIGVMIEVPSAAFQAEEIAQEVDFLSIGTNDLIQYLLAVDRTNSFVSNLYQEFHPAVLRAIQYIVEAGHRAKVKVGMCGEMAGDPLATVLLVGLELDQFSVIPGVLPEIKKIVRSIKFREAKKNAKKVLKFSTEEEVKEFLMDVMHRNFPDIPIG